MKITVFTSNRRRHLALIERLATIARRVYAIQECRSVFPGRTDDVTRNSEAMRDYFARVVAAEEEVFGGLRFLRNNVSQLALRRDDLDLMRLEDFGPALTADAFVVFGASDIKGPLADFLIEKRAVTVHMGTSPFYRGNSCNFWAVHDGRPEYVGATIHLLSKGLDSGPMLFHALPEVHPVDPFVLGMEAVRAAETALIHYLDNGEIVVMDPVPEDKSKEIRYSRREEFTDEVASEFLSRAPSPEQIFAALGNRDESIFLRPFIG